MNAYEQRQWKNIIFAEANVTNIFAKFMLHPQSEEMIF